ncbi:MAG: hypothetical protein IJO06_07375 [Thermoguttaceae bacterium]|nr:hypothetical protein [Thermoguttaceae bacterium]
MPKDKRRFDSENAVEESKNRSKASRGKGWRVGTATLTICAASFGAYYSPHFRAASSDWFERWRAFGAAKTASTDVFSEENGATADEKMREKLAQAPSFRDFLTDEYGEEGARELLGIDETTVDVAEVGGAVGGFADYVVAETGASEVFANESVASVVDAPSLPDAPEPPSSFADYVAAETGASEVFANESVASVVDAPSLPGAPEPPSSFADYVAAKPFGDSRTKGNGLSVEKTRLASLGAPGEVDVLSEDETALTARLENEMKERGVGNPRVERWGGRFWRASGFATTNEGVATFCEAVDVDPAAAQRAALTKFDAARF